MRYRILKEVNGEFLPTGQTVEISDAPSKKETKPLPIEDTQVYLEALQNAEGGSYALEADK